MKFSKYIQFGSATAISLASLFVFGGTALAAPGSDTCTYTGAGTVATFSTAANWSGCSGAAPVTGDNLVFDDTSLGSNALSLLDDQTGVTYANVTFQGPNGDSFIISGSPSTNPFSMSGNLSVNGVGGGQDEGPQFDLPFTFIGANTIVSVAGDETLSFGDYGNPSEYTLTTGANTVNFTSPSGNSGYVYGFSPIVGTGLLVSSLNSGSFTQNVASPNFTGEFDVNSGSLDIRPSSTTPNTASDFFSAVSLIKVASGATFGYDDNQLVSGSLVEPFDLAGTGDSACEDNNNAVTCGAINTELSANGVLTLSGAISLNGDTEFNNYLDNGTIQLTGALSGAHAMTVAVGTLIVAGSSNTTNTPNGTYTENVAQSASGSTASSTTTAAPKTPDTGFGLVAAHPIVDLMASLLVTASLFLATCKLAPAVKK